MKELACFKSYDIRGQVGININEEIVHSIARAFAVVLNAKKVVVARDSRESSLKLSLSLKKGLIKEGVKVLDLGLAGTEEMYFATSYFKTCGGIIVTASHNPKDFNGLKMVRYSSKPLSVSDEFLKIKKMAEENNFQADKNGNEENVADEARDAYVQKILSFIDVEKIRGLNILVNCGNGTAGPTFDALETEIKKRNSKLNFTKMFHEVDSSFPNGVPNPLLKENQHPTKEMVLKTNAELGVAFDGDFDRCFLFDEKGSFIQGEYIVGLLAEAFLKKEPNSSIVHDPRIIWNTLDVVEQNNGKCVQSKTGHVFMKEKMREVNAIYGGEISAHHYFRDFFFCDSGMIPWLLVLELLSNKNKPISYLIEQRKKLFLSSGEINLKIDNPQLAIKKVKDHFIYNSLSQDYTDGLSFTFEGWRFNLRESNTESLVRLNVECTSNQAFLDKRVQDLKRFLIGK